MNVINRDTHKKIIAKLDYEAPSYPDCGSQMKKYDFQKTSKLPYLETTGMPTRILHKNAVLSAISAQKWRWLRLPSSRRITKSLVSSTKKLLRSWLKRLLWPILPISCPFQLQLSFASSMTSVLIMIFLAFLRLCLGMSTLLLRERWVSLRKILKSSLSSLFLKVEHKLSSEITFFDRAVRCQVKIITIDMFSPYYNLAKQIHFRISRFRLKQSPRLFHSRILKSF